MAASHSLLNKYVRPFEPRLTLPPEGGINEAELLSLVKADPTLSLRPADSGVPDFAGPAPREWEMLYTFDSDPGDGPALQALVALVQAAIVQRAPSITVHGGNHRRPRLFSREDQSTLDG